MANTLKGPPNVQLEGIPAHKAQELTRSLMQLHELGKPKDNNELRDRIQRYFDFCAVSCIRPGIEALCYSLCISRKTLFMWDHGRGCDPERQEIASNAKQMISAFLEQCLMNGTLNPASGIFLLKNWCNYKDLVSLEELSNAEEDASKNLTNMQLVTRLSSRIEDDTVIYEEDQG